MKTFKFQFFRKKIPHILAIILLFNTSLAHSQVSIKSVTGDGPVILDIASQNKGVLLPRLTFTQMNAIPSPVEGLIIYCTDCNTNGAGAITVYQGGQWKTLPIECLTPLSPSPGTNAPTVTQITWNWTQVPIALGYKWNTINQYSTAIDMGSNTTFTETGLTCWTSYTRYIWAYNACGSSPVLSMTTSTSQIPFSPAPVAGTHVATLSEITWNWSAVTGAVGYKWGTTNNINTATNMGTAHSMTETNLACGTNYTRYVWAYNTCGYSTPVTLSKATINCWACGNPIVKAHVAGNVAPVSKTTTYGTTASVPGETAKCWLTSNLGSDHQAILVDDATEPSAGWYWQFNHQQGYKHDGTNRTPASSWINIIDEDINWTAANDPCTIELGNNWRIPTSVEWTNVDAASSWVNWDGPWNSLLKMHAAGRLYYNDGLLGVRGVHGGYWGSTQSTTAYGYNLYFFNNSCVVNMYPKSMGFPVRCIHD